MHTSEFEEQLNGKRLTTVDVLYYFPDQPSLIQSFVWQTLDVAPHFPRMQKFLEYWRREIDAVIHSVTISSAGGVTPAKVAFTKELTVMH